MVELKKNCAFEHLVIYWIILVAQQLHGDIAVIN